MSLNYLVFVQFPLIKVDIVFFRDIKGANILVDTNGMVKLADFGMAKHVRIVNCFSTTSVLGFVHHFAARD